MGYIRILPQHVADRIAAGEVVERPASVVKELVENSLDAGATQITVEVEGAGSTLIRVTDDGLGMDGADLRLSVQRFATSKIATADDLLEVRSFGFRGEALPSIAAVSHLEITSAPTDSAEARRIRVSGGGPAAEEVVGAPPGTSVMVRQLFFNTPARRKFLKSPSREFALIVDTVNRLALVRPNVTFRLVHQGSEVLHYPAGAAEDRVAAVLGSGPFGRTIRAEQSSGDITMTGWLGRPETARATRAHQYLFVNRRPVQSRILTGSVEQAYHQLLPVGRFPMFVLFLEMPARRLDVNVHPRKLEVRFDDDHQVFGIVSRAVRTALLDASLVRALDAFLAVLPGGRATPVPLALEGGPGFLQVAPVPVEPSDRLPAMTLLGQLHSTYLLAQSQDGLIVIDQHAAHERVLYERLLKARSGRSADSQVFVAPVSLTLDPGEAELVRDHIEAFSQLGFLLEPFGNRTVLIRGVPRIVAARPAERLLRDLLAEFADGRDPSAAQTLLERLTIATACHTAVKAGDRLGQEQMVALIRELAQTEDPFTCFHGRPTLVTIPLASVERWFLRK